MSSTRGNMTEIKRTIKLVTQQAILPDLPPVQEGYPMREWSIRLFVVGQNGEELPATMFDKVTYRLHPTFHNPNRTIKRAPFLLSERGWGEFDMEVVLYSVDKGGEHLIRHDLNFQKPKYEMTHTITFSNPRAGLLKTLAASGPVPGHDGTPVEENGVGKRDKRKHDGDERVKKKGKSEKQLDMEKLAEGLQKLDEDSLLLVVQMIHDNKTESTYVKNDVEQGEFHVDLYTLPESLQKDLWKLVQEKGMY